MQNRHIIAKSSLIFAICTSVLFFAAEESRGEGTAYAQVCSDSATASGVNIVSEERRENGCEQTALPIPASRILWSTLLPASSQTVGQQIALQVVAEPAAQERVVDVEIGGAAGQVELAVPFDYDLTDSASIRTFGIEERCAVTRGLGSIALECRAGAAPAGIVLTAGNWRFPAGVPTVVEINATAALRAAVLDATETPVASGVPQQAAIDIQVPAAAHPPRFVLSMTLPEGTERAVIDGIRLRPATRGEPQPLSAWSWSPADWLERGADLIAAARNHGIGAIYVSVPVKDGEVADEAKLRGFIRAAGRAGISVWVVEGDPRATLPSERALYRSRADAYATYNANAAPGARLAGIQYDVEPYLDPGWRLDPVFWQEAYRDFVAEMADAARMPLELALPFWIAMDEAALRRMVDPVAHRIASIAAMVYRTDPLQLQQLAEPFLAWGVRHGVEVRIALEAGPLPDEVRKVYRRAPEGTLWHLSVGATPVLLLVDQPATNPVGASFRFSHSVAVPASRISFLGDVARMRRVISEVEPALRGWPSFGGIAVHGVLPGW